MVDASNIGLQLAELPEQEDLYLALTFNEPVKNKPRRKGDSSKKVTFSELPKREAPNFTSSMRTSKIDVPKKEPISRCLSLDQTDQQEQFDNFLRLEARRTANFLIPLHALLTISIAFVILVLSSEDIDTLYLQIFGIPSLLNCITLCLSHKKLVMAEFYVLMAQGSTLSAAMVFIQMHSELSAA